MKYQCSFQKSCGGNKNMPQLVKGGKYAFGWSVVRNNGEINIPIEAQSEYKLEPAHKVIAISGSKTSGGFSIIKDDVLKKSKLSALLDDNPLLAHYNLSKGEIIAYHKRLICWTEIGDKGSIILPINTLAY